MFKSSLIYLVARVLNGLIAIASFYILSRTLTATEYGVYALGTSAIAFFSSVLFQWIAVSMARFYAEQLHRHDILMNEVARLFFLTSTLSFVLFALFLLIAKISQVSPLLAVGIFTGSVALGAHNIGLQIANAGSKPVHYGLLSTTRSVLAFLLAVGASYWGFGGAGAVLGSAIATLFIVIFFKTVQLPKRAKKNLAIRLELLRYGLPLTLTYMAMMVLDVSDRFIIGWIMGAAAVAPYAAAYDLTQQVIGALANVLFLASFPNIMTAWKRGGAEETKKAIVPLSGSMLIGAPLISGLFIGGSTEICQIVFGPNLSRDAASIMPWVVIAITIASVKSFFLDIAFQLKKTIHIQLKITMAMAGINLILTVALLPILGVVGAAVSTAISFAFGAVASWYFGVKVGIYPMIFKDIVKALVVMVCIVSAMKIYSVKGGSENLNMLINFLVGMVVYVVSAFSINLGGVQIFLMKFIKSKNLI